MVLVADRLEIWPNAGGDRRIVARGLPAASDLLEWELREWALAHRIIPEPPARHWHERTLVRGTLAGGGLIGLCWTSYQILKVLFPQFFH